MAGPGGSCLNPFEGSNLVFHLRGMHMDNYMELSLARPLEFELVFLVLTDGNDVSFEKTKSFGAIPNSRNVFFTNLSEACCEAKRWKP